MTQTRGLIVVMILALIGCNTTADDEKDDIKELQGTWNLNYFERDGKEVKLQKDTQMINTDDKFVIKRGEQVIATGTMKLDPSKKPKESKTIYTDGPDKGKTFKGIYHIDGDTVKFCRAGSPDQERPTDFKSKPDSGQFVAMYRRSKP